MKLRNAWTIAALVALSAAPAAAQSTAAAAKHDEGTIQSRGGTALANVGGPLATRLQGRPVVVRIHADWCPACKETEPVLDGVKQKYGDKVSFVTFDVTNAKTAATAADAAKADGLATFFDATKAATSTVVVIDPKSGAVIAELYNDTEVADYTKAIDRALKRAK